MRIFGIVGYSGSGKTKLITKIIPELKKLVKTISVIKHAHHGFDIDKPGKDSFEHRKSGADQVVVVSAKRWVLIREMNDMPEMPLGALLEKLSACDITLIEGFKNENFPKLEVSRMSTDKPYLFEKDKRVIGIATSRSIVTELPIFEIEDYANIAKFVYKKATIWEPLRAKSFGENKKNEG